MQNTQEIEPNKAGKLLNTLRSIQENLGYIPQTSIHELCKSFNLSYAQMYGFICSYAHSVGIFIPASLAASKIVWLELALICLPSIIIFILFI